MSEVTRMSQEEREKLHPAVKSVLEWFEFKHLPEALQEVSAPFAQLADRIASTAPADAETTVALRKLLESKDAAVRAAVRHFKKD